MIWKKNKSGPELLRGSGPVYVKMPLILVINYNRLFSSYNLHIILMRRRYEQNDNRYKYDDFNNRGKSEFFKSGESI